jgi:hypothetical protein
MSWKRDVEKSVICLQLFPAKHARKKSREFRRGVGRFFRAASPMQELNCFSSNVVSTKWWMLSRAFSADNLRFGG